MEKKPFWRKPENWMGLVIGGGLLTALGMGLMSILPLLITLASNIITLGIMGAVILGAIAFIIEQRHLISYSWRGAMRWITGFIVELDPIGIMRTYVERLKKHLAQLNEEIKNVRQQTVVCDYEIQKNKTEYENAMDLAAAAAKDSNNELEFSVQANEAGLYKRSIEDLSKTNDDGKKMLRLLEDIRDKCSFLVRTRSKEIDLLARKREIQRAMVSAISNARSIINGDPSQRELVDIALDKCAEQTARDVGEFEDFMSTTRSFINSTDLQSGVFKKEALQRIETMHNSPLLSGQSTLAPIMDKILKNEPIPVEKKKVSQ